MADFTKRDAETAATGKPAMNEPAPAIPHDLNWASEDAYWRDNYPDRPYAIADRGYDFFRPAYRYGFESAFAYGDMPWSDRIESEIALGWEQARGQSTATWDQVKGAVREAWDRVS